MIRLRNLIFESMTLYFTGDGPSTDRFDNLLDLSIKLETLLYRILGKLPQDQIDYFSKNRPADLLTPDGMDLYSSTGILNLYYSGYTKHTLELFLKEIKDKCKELNISIGDIKIEQSKMFKYQVVRIPIIKNDNVHTGPDEINLSNINFYHILKNVLQFEPDDEYGSSFKFTVSELEERILSVLKHDPEWIRKNRINPDTPKAEMGDDHEENPHDSILNHFKGSGAKIINSPLDEDRIIDILERILKYCDWCKKHNIKDLIVQ